MIMVNIFEAKAKLSEYVEAAANGERVLICKRNVPVAELRPVAAARTSPRPVGLAAGQITIPDAFFEALPDEILMAFETDAPRHALAHAADGHVDGGYAARPLGTTPKPRATRRRRGAR